MRRILLIISLLVNFLENFAMEKSDPLSDPNVIEMQWDIKYKGNLLEKTDYGIALKHFEHFKTLNDGYMDNTGVDQKCVRVTAQLDMILDNVHRVSGISINSNDLRRVLYLLGHPQLYKDCVPQFKSPILLNDAQCATLMEIAYEYLNCKEGEPVDKNICTLISINIPYIDALLKHCVEETQKGHDTACPFHHLNLLYRYANEPVRKKIRDTVYDSMLYSSPTWQKVDFNKDATACTWAKTHEYIFFNRIYGVDNDLECLRSSSKKIRKKINSIHTLWTTPHLHYDFSNTTIEYTHLPQVIKLQYRDGDDQSPLYRLYFNQNKNITMLHMTDLLALQEHQDTYIREIDFRLCNIGNIPTANLGLLPDWITFDITRNPISESFFDKSLPRQRSGKVTTITMRASPLKLISKLYSFVKQSIVSGLVSYVSYKGYLLVNSVLDVDTRYPIHEPLSGLDRVLCTILLLPSASLIATTAVGCLHIFATLLTAPLDIWFDSQLGMNIKVNRSFS